MFRLFYSAVSLILLSAPSQNLYSTSATFDHQDDQPGPSRKRLNDASFPPSTHAEVQAGVSMQGWGKSMENAQSEIHGSPHSLDGMNQDELLALLRLQLGRRLSSAQEMLENAQRTWSIYSCLNIDSKRALSRLTFQRILQTVISRSGRNVVTSRTHRESRGKVHAAHAEKWGLRMATIICDMRLVEGPEKDEWMAYKYAMSSLAKLGDVEQVEQMVRELDLRPGLGKPQVILYHRLVALSQRLRNQAGSPRQKGRWTLEPDEECKEVLWALLRSYRDGHTKLDAQNARLLIVSMDLLRLQSIDERTARMLDRMLEEIFEKFYKLDMRNLTIGASPPAFFNSDAVNALLGYLGRKGDLWRMVSAFESFTNPKQEELDMPVIQEVAEQLPASLRAQIARVPSDILRSFRGLDWTVLRMTRGTESDPNSSSASTQPETDVPSTSSSTSDRRTYADYFPSPPLPFDIVANISSSTSTAVDEDSLREVPDNQFPIVTRGGSSPVLLTNLMYRTMLVHAAEQRNVDVLMYVLRAVYSSAAESQSKWIRTVVLAHQNHSTAVSKEAIPETIPELNDPVSDDDKDDLDWSTSDTWGSAHLSETQDVKDGDDIPNPTKSQPNHHVWWEHLRRPKAHISYWHYDLVHWVLRKEREDGHGQGSQFRILAPLMEDAIERVRQERVILFGGEEISDIANDEIRDSSALSSAPSSHSPPFAEFAPHSRRAHDLLIRKAFDPAEYHYLLASTQKRLTGLLTESQYQHSTVTLSQRRAREKLRVRDLAI
ncbi:MAG: hypothetical protein TREMPRED_002818 [Tremellales sp. Tagirdzhanova-0007]|nr:MAG: hypothetical protein TREMPRED_002818 [Tremellales sp. Tagirdzhanova-0007]